MFVGDERLQVDECYTLAQRDLKYTLLHVRSRLVRSAFSSMMCKFDETYGIKSMCVFGYNAISIGDEIDEHPGMLLIANELNKASPTLQYWMANGDIKENKHGLLYPYLTCVDLPKMTKAQMLNYVRNLKSELAESKHMNTQAESLSIQIEELQRENRILKMRLETQRYIFTKAGRSQELQP